MADKVRFIIESSIPELAYLERRSYFSEDEVKSILARREDFEYRLIKNKSAKQDFLEAIQYEMELVSLKGKQTQGETGRA